MKAKIFGIGSRKGQGIVEFALAFPVFLLIIIGIFEFGRLFIVYTSVYAAAREGARFGAAAENIPTCGAGIQSSAERAGFLAGDLNVTHYYDDGPSGTPVICSVQTSDDVPPSVNVGDRVIVSVTTQFEFITGLIPTPGGSITLESVAKRTVIQNVYLTWTLPPP